MVTIPAGPTSYTLSASGVTATNAGSRGGVTLYGVTVIGTNDTVINTGTLLGNQAGISLLGINDSVTNQAGGYIHASGSGGFNGVLFPAASGYPGLVVNAGRIAAGPAGTAVVEGYGGTVINLSTGTLSGSGIYIANAAGTVVNSGLIQGGSRYGAIALYAGGSVTNFAGGRIVAGAGTYGILVTGGAGTITNAGTIASAFAGVPAVTLPAGYANRLIWLPGGVVSGTIDGGNAPGSSAVTTLELGAAADTGTLTGLGTAIINIGSVTLDPAANWVLAGSNTLDPQSTLTDSGTLTNIGMLVNNGRIELGAVPFDAGSVSGTGTIAFGAAGGEVVALAGATTNTLANVTIGQTIALLDTVVTDLSLLAGNRLRLTLIDSTTIDLQLDPAQNFDGAFFNHSSRGADSLITESTLPCFAQGTRILGVGGEVAVEELAIGDEVITAWGATRQIIWLGHRRVDCARHNAPPDVWPIRIDAGAFSPGVPRATLRLSPDHAVWIDGLLIPIRYLENGTTIRQEPAATVTYWHVELDAHDVLLAEDLPCESYLDTGNRGAFANADGPAQMHPDFALRVWAARSCAPLVVAGAELAAARLRLLDRAIQLGFAPAPHPDIWLEAGQARLRPAADAGRCRFVLDGSLAEVRLLSRSAVPAHTEVLSTDHRRLGVAVRAILADGTPVALDDMRLGAGWHPLEPGADWRWTDGAATIGCPGVRVLDIDVAFAAPAWDAPPRWPGIRAA